MTIRAAIDFVVQTKVTGVELTPVYKPLYSYDLFWKDLSHGTMFDGNGRRPDIDA